MKIRIRILSTIFLCLFVSIAFAQSGIIEGKITAKGEGLEFANIMVMGTNLGTTSGTKGEFYLDNIPWGEYTIIASMVGYEPMRVEFALRKDYPVFRLDIDLKPSLIQLDQIVVTGTKTFKRQTRSPVIVNVMDSDALDNVQACTLSEGLKFQPGLRVETDCQTCNYTQLRMNGLGGSYSQILINGRPIFSPLTGLYGMEQIPTNMIDRIEIVRGGGSALYGSSAIGGTVNVITKIPKKNSYDLSFTHQSIAGSASDQILNGNAALVTKRKNAGATLFINNRQRGIYDHNGDNFSELPELKNTSFGTNIFLQPNENQKLELSLSNLNEYRYGGEMIEEAPHLALQSEERTHHVYLASLDYQINFNNENSSFIVYLAGQHTDRKHYTGIYPDGEEDIQTHLEDPPYGISDNSTFQGGIQLNHRIDDFLGSSNIITLGGEYVSDDVLDVIQAYRYKVDQFTRNLGLFLQSDWEISPGFTLLSGIRMDRHNFVNKSIFSPRLSLLYTYRSNTQFRLTWGTGFRAPQAFDTDLHIAFAGGGVSRISLAQELKEERSNSISGSVNYDVFTEDIAAGFTIEGFYTRLKDAFYQHPIGEDSFGARFEKRNGTGSSVEGGTIEVRANFRRKAQLEAGFTLQSSQYDIAVEYIAGLEPKRTFLRTPNEYGYTTFSYMPNKKFNTTLNMVFTGSMQLAHFAGSPEQPEDVYTTSPSFTEISIKTGYTFPVKKGGPGLEVFGGIKNITNAYQDNFDSGKNRDSNYVYGPGLPRTFFAGIRVRSWE